MIFIIDSCFAVNHKKECIIVKNTTLLIEEMTDVVGALGNLYFSSSAARGCPPQAILEVLCEKMGCKDRKHKFIGEMEFVERRIQSPMLHTTFLILDELVVWIDIEEAMRYTAKRFRDILTKYFTQEEMDDLVKKWKGMLL